MISHKLGYFCIEQILKPIGSELFKLVSVESGLLSFKIDRIVRTKQNRLNRFKPFEPF